MSVLTFAATSCDDPLAKGEMAYSKDVCSTRPAFVTDMRDDDGGDYRVRYDVGAGSQQPTLNRRIRPELNRNRIKDKARARTNPSRKVTANCAPESAYGRQFTLAPPRNNELVLHVASDFTGYYYLNVYGQRGDEWVPLTSCLKSKAIHQVVHVPVNKKQAFEQLLVDVRYQTGKVLDQNPKDAFISLTAFDGQPAASREATKRGYRDECDDGGTNCYVLSTCDRGMNLEQWAQELGLIVLDKTNSEGGGAVNACVPEGFSLQTTTPPRHTGGKEKTIERDTTNGNMERNFFIEIEPIIPNPGYGEFRDKQIIDAFPCMEYRPKNGSEANGLMVTIIDSGVDASDLSFRPWDKYAATQDYSRYLRRGTYGYDFIDDDPTPDDELNHGTYVGGALISDYKGQERLTIVHHKIFDGAGRATYFGAVESVYASIEHKTNILSLSWGITDSEEPLALRCAIQEAMKNKVIVVTSAGNISTNIDNNPQWPAAWKGEPGYSFLFTVGSYWYPNLEQPKTMRAEYSNFGEKKVSVYGYLTTLVPEYQTNSTTLAFGTSISVPLVVSNFATRFSSFGGPSTQPKAFPERGASFFPNWQMDGDGNAIPQHDVRYVPVRCAGERP